MPDVRNSIPAADVYGTQDPSAVATNGSIGFVFYKLSAPTGFFQKQDNGTTTNWTNLGAGGGGITQLTGGLLAGPGSGSQAGTLAFARDRYSTINLGIAASVAANALAINLKQADGVTDPGAGLAAVNLSQRNVTSTVGGYVTRSVTAPLSIVVPSGATLGMQFGGKEKGDSGVDSPQFLYCYLLDNAGTQELAVCGFPAFDDGTIVSTTAISGAATDLFTLYSTIARANLPVRYIGKILSVQAVAGLWATAPSEIDIETGRTDSIWIRMDASIGIIGFGTPTNIQILGRRTGGTLELQGAFISGVSTVSTATLSKPASLPSNPVSNILPSFMRPSGTAYQVDGSGVMIYPNRAYILLADQFGDLAFSNALTLSPQITFALLTGAQAASVGNYVSFEGKILIGGWT